MPDVLADIQAVASILLAIFEIHLSSLLFLITELFQWQSNANVWRNVEISLYEPYKICT